MDCTVPIEYLKQQTRKWYDLLRRHVNDPVCMFIFTKSDQVSLFDQNQIRVQIMAAYSFVERLHFVSSLTEDGLDDLRKSFGLVPNYSVDSVLEYWKIVPHIE